EDALVVAAAGAVDAGDRRHERAAAGGDDELVVRRGGAVVRVHALGVLVDAGDPATGVQRDVVVRVPGELVEEDARLVLDAREDVREHDPVVVAVRLVAHTPAGDRLAAS